ncbi:haloacid dehalogenase-like hydrolase [Candidatus Falkowbacteria bacterium]|nr:haloacid dehalogenase-like hydrolase [Candidatus Falkowbacteria bacterium]
MEKIIPQMEKLEDTIIVNPEKINAFIQALKEQGPNSLHVLADFDRTITKAFVNGEYVSSIISMLRKHNYLTPDYPQKAQELFEKYHPQELDPKISKKEKSKIMEEWWRAHNKLLIASGLNIKDIESAVKHEHIQFREGAEDFLNTLKANNIPLIIFSSSGLGTDAISILLKQRGKLSDNIEIVSNTFEYDEQGNVVRIKEPIIHSLNKGEAVLKDLPAFKKVKDRKNVILLGDSVDDVGMVEGFKYDHLIKFGFLNDKVDENLDDYKKYFDLIITHDGSMDALNKFMAEIL